MESSGRWLEEALLELCKRGETGLDLDADIISGLVSYCQMASPLDAKEYLDNIIGQEAGKNVIEEYLKRRGHSDAYTTDQCTSNSGLHAYVKPPSNVNNIATTGKKTVKALKEVSTTSTKHENTASVNISESQKVKNGNQSSSKKKKSGKVVSLAEASKGSIVYQQGKPCCCQARQHRLVNNCLSCGKIVCEQEGEGPCNFCGALVLKEGSSYAGLSEGVVVPLTEDEVAAEAYAKRLVEYDRNSAARTTVIDDQSDYYGVEGNSWLSKEEKELLMKKREEIEEAERAQRSKVVMTFDLVGRKVLVNEDEGSEEMGKRIIFETRMEEREATRIKPSPNLKIQPSFVDPGPRKTSKELKSLNNNNKKKGGGVCLEISGRVQHDTTSHQQTHVVVDHNSNMVGVGTTS